ncbi:MAG: ATP-binding protein [Pseudomonadota bacterium]
MDIEKMGRFSLFLDELRARLGVVSLSAKVISGVSLILIIVMGFFTYHDTVTRVRFHFNMQEERALEISDTVMRSIEYPMLDGEMESVQAILESLYTLKDVAVVNLCDIKGIIRHSGSTVNIGKVDDSEITKRALDTSSLVKGLGMLGKEKIFHHAMPIPNEKTCYKCHGSETEILGVLTVGIHWTAIEDRIAAIRNREISLAVVSVMVVGFFLTLFLSKYITSPLSILTRLADEISRGMPGFEFGRMLKCWEVEKCNQTTCPAYGNTDIMCWYVDGTLCKVEPSGKFPEKLDMCRDCRVYKAHVGDEMIQLADSFKHMVYRLNVSEKEIKKLEKRTQLVQAAKMSTLGEVSSGIAHELNQPLNVIGVDADFIKKTIKKGKKIENEELKIVADEIRDQVDRASAIINHLRDFVRVSIKTEKVWVNKPIRNVFMIMGQQLKLREIEVQLDLDDNIPPIMADNNKLEQVFINLVINARDAIEEKGKPGGKVRIRSFLDNGKVTVVISDTGKGIPEDIIDKIFEPFFTTKEVGKGTGLGMSISYGIIKDYGGTVKASSKVGEGTSFELKFPEYVNA